MATKKQRTVTMPVGTIDDTSSEHNIKNKKYILSSKIKSFGMEYTSCSPCSRSGMSNDK